MKFYLGNGKSLMICSKYSVKYCTELKVKPSQKIQSIDLIKLIELIGSHFKNEIRGNNSNQHKGLQKIIMHCHSKNYGIVTNTEIKKLLRSYKGFDKTIKGKKIEAISCPYSAPFILKSIMELSSQVTDIKKVKDSFTNYLKNEKSNCVDIFIPDFYRLLESFIDEIDEIELNAQSLTIPTNQLERLRNTKNNFDKLFSSPCFPQII